MIKPRSTKPYARLCACASPDSFATGIHIHPWLKGICRERKPKQIINETELSSSTVEHFSHALRICTYGDIYVHDEYYTPSMLGIGFYLNADFELSKNSSIALNFNRRSTCLWSFDFSYLPTTFPSCAFQHLGKRKLRRAQPQLGANKIGDTVPIRSEISCID